MEQPLGGKSETLQVFLESNRLTSKVLSSHQRSSKSTEWVKNPVAGIGDPIHDKLCLFQWEAEEAGCGEGKRLLCSVHGELCFMLHDWIVIAELAFSSISRPLLCYGYCANRVM